METKRKAELWRELRGQRGCCKWWVGLGVSALVLAFFFFEVWGMTDIICFAYVT